jgi:hypothetical protein
MTPDDTDAANRPEFRTAIRQALPSVTVAAVASVGWWNVTASYGVGDLRPYLLLQALPLILIPLWQSLAQAPIADRRSFGIAIFLYVLAKVTEVLDRPIYSALAGAISGHTIKHLLAAAATAVLVDRLIRRTRLGLRPA